MWTVADIMTKTVFTIRSSAKVHQAIALMQEKQVRSLVVERDVAGGTYNIITEQDIVYRVTANGGDPTSTMVGEIMQQPCTITSLDVSLPAAAREMCDKGIQRMPVVEDDRVVGMISLTDIVMKSDVASVELPSNFADRVEAALRSKRLHWDETGHVDQDSKMARGVLAELSVDSPAR